MERRFASIERLYGARGAAQIAAAHVCVVGLGGVGSWAAEALARSGVGRLTLIDLDHVSESNINRQIQATDGTIGMAKVIAMRDRIGSIHPVCRVEAVDAFVEAGNWPALIGDGIPDALIDASDDPRAKEVLAGWSIGSGVDSFITVGAAGGKRLAHRVDIDDLARVTHDPLLARLRQRLRKFHGAPREGRVMGIACVFSREEVKGIANDALNADANGVALEASRTGDNSLNCAGYGSVVSVTATFGQCAAGWILDRLASESAFR